MLLGVRCEWLPATEKIWESEVRKQLWMESIAYCFFFFFPLCMEQRFSNLITRRECESTVCWVHPKRLWLSKSDVGPDTFQVVLTLSSTGLEHRDLQLNVQAGCVPSECLGSPKYLLVVGFLLSPKVSRIPGPVSIWQITGTKLTVLIIGHLLTWLESM